MSQQQRRTKKAKSKDQAIARASEEAPITRTTHQISDNDHLYYTNPGVRIDHLSPRARKLLGARAF